MIGRIIEVAQDGRYLHAERGFLVIKDGQEEAGRVPLDDIAAVIGSGHGLVLTQELLVRLAERNAVYVCCSNRYEPVAMLWSVDGFHRQAGRMDAQLAAPKPLLKKLWQTVVRAKLTQQAAVLEAWGAPTAPILALMPKVRSGDPDNIEAQAARRYWTLLFGESFRRDRAANDENALLNYGYTILRSATARAVIGAGLHPTVPLHHQNQLNSMRLVDDLMEPFRPLVDCAVRSLTALGETSVTAGTKRQLALLLYKDMPSPAGQSPVIQCIERLCVSLAQVFEGEREQLEFPLTLSALELRNLVRAETTDDLAVELPDHVDDGDV